MPADTVVDGMSSTLQLVGVVIVGLIAAWVAFQVIASIVSAVVSLVMSLLVLAVVLALGYLAISALT